MTKQCNAPELGAMLHAYELGALSEEDTERFELHTMTCEFCFGEVASLEEHSIVLQNSDSVQQLVARTAPETDRSRSSGLLRYLWPDAPMIFRPAVTLLLVVLMAIPAYLGLRVLTSDSPEIRSLQAIRLTSTRSVGRNILSIGSGLDGAIGFAVPECAENQPYEVAVTDEQDAVIVHLDACTMIDERGMGEIVFPHNLMKVGTFHLAVTCSDSGSDTDALEYTFVIKE